MNPEDISKFYYCFTRAGGRSKQHVKAKGSKEELYGHFGDGMFYRYLQKSLTKTIRNFDQGNLRFMFTNYSDEERSRLNTGVRGRLFDRFKTLKASKSIRGYDLDCIQRELTILDKKQWKAKQAQLAQDQTQTQPQAQIQSQTQASQEE
mmetsp:Transcript_16845/g.28549  ORF Transcript_16845/g.28549 Transcript_16845/m.28549 type:complete len:149 (+) Transcript_16845:438-884(+)